MLERAATVVPTLVALAAMPVLTGGPVPAAGPGSVLLVRDRQPAATIVLGDEPSSVAQFAACELQWHLKQISGAVLPIVHDGAEASAEHPKLFVGDTDRARQAGLTRGAFGPQEHAVRFLPGAIVLVGRDSGNREQVVYDMHDLASGANWPGFWEERGTLNAVYDFLEKLCGVRWLNPTESGAVVPTAPTLAVKARDIRRSPAFEYRDAIGATGDNPARYDAYTALWREDTEGFRRYEAAAYPGLHEQYPDPNRYNQAKRMSSHLFLLRLRNGGQVCRCNHSLYGYYQRYWEKSAEPDAARLFVERRPEMFAQGYEGQPPQMCYTSRALIDQLAEDARDYYDGKRTGAELGIFWRPTLPNPFPVEPMDNSSFCQCPDCQRWLAADRKPGDVFSTGVYSDYFFSFVNEVQEGLAETHPDRSIVTLAYASHAMLPERVKLDPRVIVQFCFAANRSPASRASYRSELAALRAWGTEGVGRPLYLWLYYTFPVETANNGRYHCFPGFFAHAIDEQFRLFRKYGYRGMFHCGYGQEVEAYLTFKLMDDPEAKVGGLLDDYFSGLYGPAAEPMKRLYREIEKTYCDPANYPRQRASGAEVAWGYLGTEERMERFAGLLDEARALAATDLQKHRLKLFELGVWDYMVAGRRQYVGRAEAPVPSLRAPRLSDAEGDPRRVDWGRAAPLGTDWHERGGDQPSARRLSGRLAHDGQCLYLELTDPCDTAKLEASAMVFPCDDWELFIAGQRALPYRQYAVGPTGLVTALSHGEVNFRTNVPLEDHGVVAYSDTGAPDQWVVRLALPLASVIPGGAAPGGKLYVNILRVSSPAISGQYPLGIDTWVSHSTVHEVDRLAEITLE